MLKISTAALFLSTLFLQAEAIQHYDNNATTQENIKIKTVRNVLGANDPIAHSKGQLRTGYITFQQNGENRTNAYGLGGHFHFDTKRWNGLAIGLSAYTVLNLGINQNTSHMNGDFFDADTQSFMTLSEAYLDGKWGETELKLGRQLLDTPHADSDDIRMMPNYFEAYTISNNDIENLTLTAGYITRMAGWENGIDSKRFVNIGETLLGPDEHIDGTAYVSAIYDGIKDLSLSVWYYNYADIANVLYLEAGYAYAFSEKTSLTLGLQYDGSKETGAALLQEQDSQTFGISMELAFESIGIHILGAYNQDHSDTGATGLSMGGGPFFTSMEDQTLDAIGGSGRAWMLGLGYHLDTVGIDGLVLGLAYGDFKAKNSNDYASNEIDVAVDYSFNEKISLTAAYASVRFDTGLDEDGNALVDYDQFRVIANYNF